MRKPALYSRSARAGPAPAGGRPVDAVESGSADAPVTGPMPIRVARRGWRAGLARAAINPRVMWAALALLGALLLASIWTQGPVGARALTQKDIDAAVLRTLTTQNLPSAAVATRLGSRNRGPGVLPEPLQDIAIDLWGQTRDEWTINRTRLNR